MSINTDRQRLTMVLLALSALAALLLAVLVGSVPVPVAQWWPLLQGKADPLNHTLVFELRLPRALAAFAVGGCLAVAGALMQVLLRNPLADPYVLGLSGGAASAALLAMLAGISGVWLSGSAFGGALLSTLLVFGLARHGGVWNPLRLLLTGVVVAAGWGALISLLLATSPQAQLPGLLYWLMGDMAYARSPWPPLITLLVVCLVLWPLGRHLNLLARGPQQAAALGMAVQPMETLVFVLASGLTAVAVMTAGSIGFVGLVVPHLLRLVIGNDQRHLLPACALAGGTLLLLADTLARTVIAPQQLPVGVITALLGVPVFLWLLRRSVRL